MGVGEAMDLLVYLEDRCDGCDRHSFTDPDGRPDLDAARAFAQKMRAVLGPFLGDFVCVEQRNHLVTLTLALEPVGARA